MRGIILAGGTGSRLSPLTKVTNKHLLPVGRQPMILHPLRQLVYSGIKDIMIITGREHMGDMLDLLGSGKEYSCNLTYRVQDEAGGIAEALLLCEDFARNNLITVMLGDNIYSKSLDNYIFKYEKKGSGAMILLCKVSDASRFGVAELNGDVVINIEEKPKIPKSDLAVTGTYFYDQKVFDIVKGLHRSNRGELEITDVNNAYIKAGQMTAEIFDGEWTDAGTHPSLLKANILVGKKDESENPDHNSCP